MLIVIRHPPTVWENIQKIQGRLDVQLADGWEQIIHDNIRMLKHAGRIFSSPLQRCKMVGKLISKRFEIPLIVKDILIEMDFGEFQGKTWKQISKEYPKELYEKIMNNNNRLSNGLPIDGNIGYPKGETFSNLLNRTATLFELINPDENTLCITHSQTIKAIIYNARKRRYNILPIYSKDLEGGIIIVSNVDCVY